MRRTVNPNVRGSSPRRGANVLWGYSSAGRAVALQAKGHRFDPVYLHQVYSPVRLIWLWHLLWEQE
jgi:hypothetical protein